jgi:hypothetical protein
MKRFLPSSAYGWALGVFLSIGGLTVADTALAACLTPEEARWAVASGEAMRLGEIAMLVDGDIVNAELCERGNRLVYQLAVLRGGGQVETVEVDARTGAVLR